MILKTTPNWRSSARRGGIMVLAAVLMVVVLAFAAFTVDIGFITLTKGQLQNACDAAALAAAQDLKEGLARRDQTSVVDTSARTSARAIAGMHHTGDRSSIHVDSARDVRFGQAVWNAETRTWAKTWGQAPFNLVEVSIRRNNGSEVNSDPDGPLNLFLAPVIGNRTASLKVTSTVALPVGVGVRRPPRGGAGIGVGPVPERVDVLPIAVDEESWNSLIAGNGPDQWTCAGPSYVPSPEPNGTPELNIYPQGGPQHAPGCRGTVDIGSAGNSTKDLKRQIVDGLSDSDLSYFPNSELRFDNGPLYLNGDTGLSAGIEDALISIIGQTRLIPIFRSVGGNGNTTQYEIIKFVGVRIIDVQLSGAPRQKRVVVEPCSFSSSAVIRGGGEVTADSYFASQAIIP